MHYSQYISTENFIWIHCWIQKNVSSWLRDSSCKNMIPLITVLVKMKATSGLTGVQTESWLLTKCFLLQLHWKKLKCGNTFKMGRDGIWIYFHTVCTPGRRCLSKKQHVFPISFAHAWVTQQKSESIQSFFCQSWPQNGRTHTGSAPWVRIKELETSPPITHQIWSLIFFPRSSTVLILKSTPASQGRCKTRGHGQVRAQEFPALVFGGLPFLSLHLISSTSRVLGVFSIWMSSLMTHKKCFVQSWPAIKQKWCQTVDTTGRR